MHLYLIISIKLLFSSTFNFNNIKSFLSKSDIYKILLQLQHIHHFEVFIKFNKLTQKYKAG